MCNGYPVINRDYLGINARELRHRNGYDAEGKGVHGSRHAEPFNSAFYDTATDWSNNLNFYVTNFFEGGGQTVPWLGDAGTCRIGSGTSLHYKARAFDLTYVNISGGSGNFVT